MKFLKHLKTVCHHRRLVRKYCFKLGLYRQGLTHDLSKFSPVEFLSSVKYYQGDRSPLAKQREAEGYSAAWLHHKGRNKHHHEYWTDFSAADHKVVPVKMPLKYVAEMFCDRVSATRTYNGENYNDGKPLEYYEKTKYDGDMHPETARLLKSWLVELSEKGEKETFAHIKAQIKAARKAKNRR